MTRVSPADTAWAGDPQIIVSDSSGPSIPAQRESSRRLRRLVSYVAQADASRGKKKSGPLFEFNFLRRLAIILAFVLVHLLVGCLCNESNQFSSGFNDRGTVWLLLSSMKIRFCQWSVRKMLICRTPDPPVILGEPGVS